MPALTFSSWPQDGPPTCLARPWTPKQPKLAQPDLDFIAPEIQLETSKLATVGCDVFSLGLLVCSVYNGGRSLVQAAYNPAVYMRHIDQVRSTPNSTKTAEPVEMPSPGVTVIGPIPWSHSCLLYTSPSPRDRQKSRMPSSA